MTEENDREWMAKLLADESGRRQKADDAIHGRLNTIETAVAGVQKKLLGTKGFGLLLGIAVAAAAAAYPQVAAAVGAISSALSASPAVAAPSK
jgi:hypothetical protein